LISRDCQVVGEGDCDFFEAGLDGCDLFSKLVIVSIRYGLDVRSGKAGYDEGGYKLVKVVQGAADLAASALLAGVGQWGTWTTVVDLKGTATDAAGCYP
jgi:hypothetical protein